jgi:twitching motility protein PilJ
MKNFFKKKESQKSIPEDRYSLAQKSKIIKGGHDIKWTSKIPIKTTAIVAIIALVSSVGLSIYITQTKTKTLQAMSYVNYLKDLSSKIDKDVLQANASNRPFFKQMLFGNMKLTENNISVLINTLKVGGSFNGEDTIDPMTPNLSENIIKLETTWIQTKTLIDKLKNQGMSFTPMMRVRGINQLAQELENKTNKFEQLASSKDEQTLNNAKKLSSLSSSIKDKINKAFLSGGFSIEVGYLLINDLYSFNQIIDGFKNGSAIYNIKQINDSDSLAQLEAMSQNLKQLSIQEELTKKVTAINDANDITKNIDTNIITMKTIGSDLNLFYNINLHSLDYLSKIVGWAFGIGITALILMIFAFYDREKYAKTINSALEKSQNNQKAVDLLLNQIDPMSNGDFTHRIYVSDRFVTQIAEKLDSTREIFLNIVMKIKKTSYDIVSNANKTNDMSKDLLNVSDMQYIQMEKSIDKLGLITSQMDEVAQSTWVAQEESQQSREASKQGKVLVSKSVIKMNEIRNNIQESSKKIKKSSESAQAISEVTVLIQNITKQIEILALNAAIQAASSGESGREFTVVAQEVQRLAFDSKEATQQILSLVKEVQEDIGVAVSSMEITTQEVIEGAKLTEEAGRALNKIEALSTKVANTVHETSQQLEEKSSAMAKISLDMRELQDTTNRSKNIVQETAIQVIALKSISKELNDAVETYKVK